MFLDLIRTTASNEGNKNLDFTKLLYEQHKFGKNEVVRRIEEKLGNFPFDDQLVNDGVPKIIVGPQEIEENAIYYGHWNPITNERHGFGMQLWPDGSKYIGYWKNDKADGKGRLIHHDGDVYIGDWKDDMTHGYGEYTDASGMKYKGQWRNDQQEGRGNRVLKGLGREEWADGAVYEGSYKDGMKNGEGKFTWADGSSFEGEFKNNLIEGRGIKELKTIRDI